MGSSVVHIVRKVVEMEKESEEVIADSQLGTSSVGVGHSSQ